MPPYFYYSFYTNKKKHPEGCFVFCGDLFFFVFVFETVIFGDTDIIR